MNAMSSLILCMFASILVGVAFGQNADELISKLIDRKVNEHVKKVLKNQETQDEKIRELESIIKNQETQNEKIPELESIIKNQEVRIRSLERQCNIQMKERKYLNELVGNLKSKNELKYEAEPTELFGNRENETSISNKYSNKRMENSNRFHRNHNGFLQKRIPADSIAFYAYMSKSQANPGQLHAFIFDVVKTNVGSACNKYSGMFTALAHGYYVFTWTVVSNVHGYIFAEIVINSDPVGSILTNSEEVNNEHTVTGIVVVEVDVGNVVFIRTNPSRRIVGPIWSHPYYRTSFSGWKLF